MRHFTFCWDCYHENTESIIWAEGEVTSDLVALCTCTHGHKFVCGLMHDLFDVLYYSAVDAYIKGCFSESIMSFAASLERTYEMFIKVTMLKENVTLLQIDKFWQEVKNQSERQYGAFCLQYIKVTGESWLVDNKQVSFRNKVIHKGHIATSDEARNYAEYTTACQFKILKKLNTDFKTECNDLYFYQKELSKSSTEKLMKEHNAKPIKTSFESLLKWHDYKMDDVTFQNALETMLRRV
jgi:hypothetical protein